jgi:hypothetical protein
LLARRFCAAFNLEIRECIQRIRFQCQPFRQRGKPALGLNPKAMDQIHASFVTVEPKGGSDKPSGKQLM